MTSRRQWLAAVKVAPFPASQRPMKATLLVLADRMTATGELHVWREEMVKATGVPPRTLDRHLHHALIAGWLVRKVCGGNGRRSLFLATIPGESCAPHAAHNSEPEAGRCAPRVAHNSGSCAPSTRHQLPRVVRHLAANSVKKSANVSERVALDDQRGRRIDHAESRDPRAVVAEEKSSNYQEVTAWPAPPSADGPGAQGVRKPGNETARERVARATGPIPWPVPTDDELTRRAAAVRQCQARLAKTERRPDAAAR
jgi:hypothetical protein